MNTNDKNNEVSNNINAFLLDQSRREYIFTDKQRTHSLLKSHYDDDTDFLYHQYEYQNPHPQRIDQKPDYAGIISYKRGMIFDPAYCLREWIEGAPSREDQVSAVKEKINTEILRLVDDKPVEVTDQAEPCRIDRDYFLKYEADSEAYGAFYAGQTIPAYSPYCSLSNLSTADFVRIINDEQGFVEDTARAFIVKKANGINNRLWELDVVRERLNGLLTSPGEHHVRRAIADSITGDMKMVTVHVEKDGRNGDFKVEACRVVCESRSNSYISTYAMDAPGRRKFEKMFGRHENLQISDISQITYSKKVLYQKQEGNAHEQ